MANCETCTEKCLQAEMANDIAKGRMYATQEFIRVQKELERYQKAEAEGRLLVLPCKVGDTVYLPQKNDWGDLLSFEVIEIGVDRDGPFFVIDDEEHDHIPMSDIGADVFLSREEAEEAPAKEDTP